jgi:hypothetical protein
MIITILGALCLNKKGEIPMTTATPSGAFPLVSLVWIQRRALSGLFQNQDPGLLIARERGRISLVTLKEKVFDSEKHEISTRWPWYQFGQGVRLKVAGKTYSFAWMPGGATSQTWGMRQRMEVVSTLAGREGLNFAQLAPARAWRNYLKT